MLALYFIWASEAGAILLTRTNENLTPREIEQKAGELAYFLHVPIEVF